MMAAALAAAGALHPAVPRTTAQPRRAGRPGVHVPAMPGYVQPAMT